jgi:hypothetical protein
LHTGFRTVQGGLRVGELRGLVDIVDQRVMAPPVQLAIMFISQSFPLVG